MHLWSLVKDGFRANVATATPVPAVIGTFFASDSEQITVFAVSIHEPLSTPLLHPAPWASPFMGPKYFQMSHKANLSSPLSPPMMSKTLNTVLSGKQSILSQSVLWQEESPADEGAGTGVGRCSRWGRRSGWRVLGRVLWVRGPRLDVDKVRRVLEGKARGANSRCRCRAPKEVGRTVSRDARSVAAILEESMKSLGVGKEIKSVFGWFVYSHSFSL